jgi:hypothetical protein
MWKRDQDLVNLYDAGDPGRWVHLVLALPSALCPTERGWERQLVILVAWPILFLVSAFPSTRSRSEDSWEGTGGEYEPTTPYHSTLLEQVQRGGETDV